MGMTLTGTVKNGGAYEVGDKKLVLISFTVADELGNTFACQMWPDNPQHADLARIIGSMRYQPVQLAIVSYTSRLRKMKDGKEVPQTNFIVSNVQFPGFQQNGAAPAPAAAATR